MEAVISANVVIDRKYEIKLTDYQFSRMVGERHFGYFGSSVHPEDLPEFQTAANTLQLGEHQKIMMRLLMADNSYRPVVADFSYASENDALKGMISILLLDISAFESFLLQADDKIQELTTYLTMTGGFIFSYDRKEDALVISDIASGKEIELFSGSLEDWKSRTKGFEVSEESQRNFQDLYDQLLHGRGKFAAPVTLGNPKKGTISMLSPNMLKNSFLVSGKYVVTDDKEMVYGYISLRGTKGRFPVSPHSEQEMDSAFDVFNKKGITDFARSKIESRTNRLLYLCIVDIDNFKNVNDKYGHMYGDEVIRRIIDIMKLAVDDRGVVGRIGGDEFMVILDRNMCYADLRKILQTIRGNVEWTYGPDQKNIGVTVSIGCANYPDNADNYNDVFTIADKMLYRAKEKGKNRFIIYEPEIHGDVLQKDTDKKGMPAVNAQEGVVNKEGFVMKFAEVFLEKKTLSFSVAVQRIGKIFDLDEVCLFRNPTDLYSVWEKEPDHKPKSALFALEQACRNAFNENNRLVIDNIRDVQGFYPQLYDYMTDRGIHVMLIYRCVFQEGGYCLFIKKSNSSRKWPNEDVTLLTLLGHMMDMELNYR